MNIQEYCKNKKYTKEEYALFKSNIKAIAAAIYTQLNTNNTIYRSFNIFNSPAADTNVKGFIIQELKKLGVEFNNNYTMYRV